MTTYMLLAGFAILVYTGMGPGLRVSFLPNESQAETVGGEADRALLAGRTLFQERGCITCHQSETTCLAPTLHGLFGTAVHDPKRGIRTVDESYLREAILDPSATLADGFPPIMPTFAGQLTEEELQALILYVRSLSVSVSGD